MYLGFDDTDLSGYTSVIHISGMEAALALAQLKNDQELTKRCRANLEAARNSMMKYLWNGEYFGCWWSKDNPENTYVHTDTLYGQLWSYLLGFSHIINPEAMRSHLRAEEQYADTPYGLKVIVDTSKGSNSDGRDMHDTVWPVASITWTGMKLFLGDDVDKSLSQGEKVVKHWAYTINDQWDYRDLSAGWDGTPYCNSHYGRQLMFWAFPLGLTGQDYSAVEQRLSFDPKTEAPYRFPFYTPKANGVLEAEAGKPLRLRVILPIC